MRNQKLCVLWALVCALLLLAACGEKEAPDYSGRYTDKQGTAEVYSELALTRQDGGGYALSLEIHRVAAMVGTAAETGEGTLHFDCYAPDLHVAGDITISGETAEAVVTASNFSGIAPGEVFRFPDGKE